jgi:cellulose synthase/poly-beta-1,6-N-acetylglucosamine synthase-like glycosyltransferase
MCQSTRFELHGLFGQEVGKNVVEGRERTDLLKVTIGISSFNEKHNIERILNALMAQRGSREVKVVQIIVSDDSDDNTSHLVERYLKQDRRLEL